MLKEHHPSPLAGGKTGTFTDMDTGKEILVLAALGATACVFVGAVWLHGRITGKKKTLKDLAVKYNLIDGDKKEDMDTAFSDLKI